MWTALPSNPRVPGLWYGAAAQPVPAGSGEKRLQLGYHPELATDVPASPGLLLDRCGNRQGGELIVLRKKLCRLFSKSIQGLCILG